ncbi:MAG: DNA polymerase III subunit gamma/tau [Bacteroidales bacterium]|jgi:DNA polymerase-3 subunit gamma/tau|nr:DNA polymerase III subunit gamma/tau [Bacteroidales bacterium]
MENFIVSARKYRPATFDMVVGQDSITATLRNAIKNNYLAQSYLFCGPRGVGKTTCARIFAKTINCSNLGENAEPCDKCESCVSFNSLRSLNIHELDAASNNKVEDIRSLTDQVRIPPQIGKYSVYIIDEVHMLSSSAFNAFLKTLEEPPSHAIFILATTEKHKIIPTILSRCQIFDFNRISTVEMVNRLKYVAEKEKVNYEEEALHIISMKADGALRDALSIFDQIVSFGKGKISYKDVIENLNLLDYEYYFRVVDAALEGNYRELLMIFDEVLENGFDGHNFISGLGSHLRDLLVSRDDVTMKLLDTTPAVKQKYRQQSQSCTVDFLFSSLEICNNCDISYKMSKNQRLMVELALFRMSYLMRSETLKETAEKKKNELKNETDIPAGNDTTIPLKSEVQLKDSADLSGKNKERAEKGTEGKSGSENPGVSVPKTFSVRDALTNGVHEPALKGKTKEPATGTGKEKSLKEFNDKNLRIEWLEYASHIKAESPRISGQLTEGAGKLSASDKITVSLSNTALKEEFDRKYRSGLEDFLLSRLNCQSLTIESRIEEPDRKDASYYTDEQKFAYLTSKNPALRELRRNLNLDFE